MVIDNMLVYRFVHPDLIIEIFFEKEGAGENGGLDISSRGHRHLCTLVLEVK